MIILTIRVIGLIIGHLYIVFSKEGNELAVKQILKNPHEYVSSEHMCKFMYDMVWLYIFLHLLWGIFSEKLIIN